MIVFKLFVLEKRIPRKAAESLLLRAIFLFETQRQRLHHQQLLQEGLKCLAVGVSFCGSKRNVKRFNVNIKHFFGSINHTYLKFVCFSSLFCIYCSVNMCRFVAANKDLYMPRQTNNYSFFVCVWNNSNKWPYPKGGGRFWWNYGVMLLAESYSGIQKSCCRN